MGSQSSYPNPTSRRCLTSADYEEYHPRIQRYLSHQLGRLPGGPTTLEDLTAQVFSRALYAEAHGNGCSASLAGWLFQIARSVIADHLKSRRREPVFEPLTSILSAPSHHHVEREVLFALEAEHMTAHLRPEQKELLHNMLLGYDGLQLAEIYQVSPLCVRQRIVRLRKHMRKRFRS